MVSFLSERGDIFLFYWCKMFAQGHVVWIVKESLKIEWPPEGYFAKYREEDLNWGLCIIRMLVRITSGGISGLLAFLRTYLEKILIVYVCMCSGRVYWIRGWMSDFCQTQISISKSKSIETLKENSRLILDFKSQFFLELSFSNSCLWNLGWI